MILTITKENGKFVVDKKEDPGSPAVGRGKTIMEAIGSYFHYNQIRFGIEFVVDAKALAAELRRRKRELYKR